MRLAKNCQTPPREPGHLVCVCDNCYRQINIPDTFVTTNSLLRAAKQN